MKKLLLAIPVLIDKKKRLTDCLAAAFEQTLVKSGEADVYVIINHPKDESLMEQVEQFDSGYVIENKHNLGVSGSWNQAIVEAESGDYKYVCCCGFDTVMTRDTLLEKSVAQMEETDAHFGRGNKKSFNYWMMDVERCPAIVGKFDENFYPGYWEDIDYMRRLRMLRDKGIVTTVRLDDDGKIEHSQSRTVNDHETLIPKDVWDFSYSRNQLYIRAKWGTDKDDHKLGFTYPFNDKRLHTSFWVVNPQEVMKSKKKWDECLKNHLLQNE